MKNSKIHIGFLFALVSLVAMLLFSSVTSYYLENETSKIEVAKTSADSGKNKEAKVDVSNGLLAIVVSIINMEFCKVTIVQNQDFIFSIQKTFFYSKNNLVKENYFNTLFTHIIAPNAP